MIDVNITEEEYDRVSEALDNISCSCDLDEDYEEWWDIAKESITESFEGLERVQTYRTYAAWEEQINSMLSENPNIAKGLIKALTTAVKEYSDYIELNYGIDEDYYELSEEEREELYDTEAAELKEVYDDCLQSASDEYRKYEV
mgnify:CR=1 FL=1|jgi:hypothetical protein